ncbi:MAG TPA: hypothetical protein VFE33_25725 [Thermoanaerobaculia bacterium]|nr:hypothetical protein [Thermoanaerobaculia bacterium]
MKMFEVAGTDEVYESVRMEINSQCREAKSFLQSLWTRAEAYLDSDLSLKITRDFHQRFWELYLASALLDAGLPLLPRKSERVMAGPDICISIGPERRIWVEAVAVSPGTGPDAVQEATPGVAQDVPDDPIKLRLLNAFDEKYRKHSAYLKKGVVCPSDPYVIAINAAMVPSAMLEREVPRIVRSLLPFGHSVIHLDRESLKAVGSGHRYQGTVTKLSGAEIPTDAFLNSTFGSVSAVLYSWVDAFNHPDELGADLLLLHNPLALNSLDLGFLRRGHEFWVEWSLRGKTWNMETQVSES